VGEYAAANPLSSAALSLFVVCVYSSPHFPHLSCLLLLYNPL
jgi:hypothetical protein